MAGVSDYEKLRQQNIADNKRILAELGLLNPFEPLPRVIKKAPKRKRQPDVPKPEKRVVVPKDEPETLGEYGSKMDGSRRRSSRLTGQAPLSESEIEAQAKKWQEEECEEGEEGDTPNRKGVIKRPMAYGAIPGVEVGTVWPMRIDCNAAGIHRPTVAGIHGGAQGAYSIVLSGGYEDNIDLGTCFTYTGEGGRDLKGTAAKPKNLRTAPQSKDQCLSRGNAALVKSTETGFPVRVVRGFKLTSPFAPEDGYRYDGLYRVEKWWYTVGIAGYGVYKFALKRLEDQAPPPWSFEGEEAATEGGTQDSGVGSEVGSDSGSEENTETTGDNTDNQTPSDDQSKPAKNEDMECDDKAEDLGSNKDIKNSGSENSVKRDEKAEPTRSEHKQEVETGDGKEETKEPTTGSESKEKVELVDESTEKTEKEGCEDLQEVKAGVELSEKKEAASSAGKQEVDSGDKVSVNKEKKKMENTQEVGSGNAGKQEVRNEKTEKEGDKENEESLTPGQKQKAGRRLSGKGNKQEPVQKNTMLKYFNKT